MTRMAVSGIMSRRQRATVGVPGTRIPTLIVSPYAKKGFVDHTLYDTTSVLGLGRLITRRFDLPVLSGLRARDEAMSAAGGQTLGDLTGSLDLGP